MMSALAPAWREFAALTRLDLTVGARTRAFAAALALHVALLGAFVVLWSGGVPLLPGDNLYEQQRLVDWVFLVALLPWVCSRCGADERGDRLVLLSALAATTTSRVLGARFSARALAALAVALAGFPLMVVAQQISAVPLWRALVDILPLAALALTASAMAVWWGQCNGVILAWGSTTASTIAAVILVMSLLPRNAALVALAAFAIAAGSYCSVRSNSSLRYLSERQR